MGGTIKHLTHRALRHEEISKCLRSSDESRTLVSTVGAVYDRALFPTTAAKRRICDERRAVIDRAYSWEIAYEDLFASAQQYRNPVRARVRRSGCRRYP